MAFYFFDFAVFIQQTTMVKGKSEGVKKLSKQAEKELRDLKAGQVGSSGGAQARLLWLVLRLLGLQSQQKLLTPILVILLLLRLKSL